MLRSTPSRIMSSTSASESLFLVAAAAAQALVEEGPLMIKEVARTKARQEMEAAKTKARVAVTHQVAVAGVEDADDALRRGAGG